MSDPAFTTPTPGRSRNMAAIKRRDTGPERAIRTLLHAAGRRYRVDLRLDLPGGRPRPDIAFTRARVAVFIDGCFWHCCPQHGRRPQVNADYWALKLERNVARDRAADEALLSAGWAVVRIWEHEAPDEAVARIASALDARRGS
ncbi:very short patch repair endonuclease [Streptomyces sp. MUM 2J]|nr:very short patch repair endonuclease [Streptomyces sp. MUM 2J]MCH0567407.1 very short patch repair endonuclease [Streptomyces sp. MUM 2J]